MSIEDKVKDRSAKICVIGLGYVGLPLALEFAEAGFTVSGYDTDERRVDAIRSFEYYAEDTQTLERLKKHMSSGRFDTHKSASCLENFDAAIVCVPTPIDTALNPAMNSVLCAFQDIYLYLRPGSMVILESTTYPTTLQCVARPILETGGLVAGKDFYLLSSPERIDPGNKQFSYREILKLVGGVDSESTRLGVLLYSTIKDHVVPVDSPEIAEASKMLENIYRLVNISLINELSQVFERMGIDTWKVIRAATTKPFGFAPFYPGPGAGGHCIPVDPLYMSFVARLYGMELELVDRSAMINLDAPCHVVDLVSHGLNEVGKPVRSSKIMLLGASYKPGVADTRNAASATIREMLVSMGASVDTLDPCMPGLQQYNLNCLPDLVHADCVVVLVRHPEFVRDRDMILTSLGDKAVLVDCVDLFEYAPCSCVYVGLGKKDHVR